MTRQSLTKPFWQRVGGKRVNKFLHQPAAAIIIAALAGAALPLAFAPFDWVWLAVLSPAALFALATALPRRVALASAYSFGIGYFGVGVSWVYVSISRYGNGPVVASAVTIAFVALLALFPSLVVYLVRKLRPQMDVFGFWLGFPAAWILSEWLRSWFLTGFPWLLLGYSQTDTLLANIAPVFGVAGVSLALVVLACALGWFVLCVSVRRAMIAAAVASAILMGAKLLDRPWSGPSGPPLTVALVQGNIEQDTKWDPAARAMILGRYRTLTIERLGVDLVVWPEAAVPMWYSEAAAFLDDLAATAAQAGTALVVGVPMQDEEGRAYNAVVNLGSDRGIYRKRHLVPFGEYIPLRDFFGSTLDILGAPMSGFSAGDEAEPLDAAGLPMGTFICYEAAFPMEVADLLPEAELLINVSNDAWFGESIGPLQHFQITRMRAIEAGRALLRVANTGVTAVIAADGSVTARAPQFEVATITAEVAPRQGATPFVHWREWPVVGLGGLVLLLLALGRSYS
ncbi:apolipoprotein N-acyltransferase [Yanghanlia caeni]|uniref:Apolipoprotein N-acyltransferase n=1 Tax=Yanghanlia caeni TaxID=3064283 RepID=A0ABU1D9Q1_9BURK|nr:apolipoprotein N-acyltransferase [Alcaligenaceae bacterium LG-2]